MSVKDCSYIILIIIALGIGAMLNTHDETAKLSELEKDLASNRHELTIAKHKYDSMLSVAIRVKGKITEDSIAHINITLQYNSKIKSLNRKVNEISFKDYSDNRLDSLINALYGPGTIHRAQ